MPKKMAAGEIFVKGKEKNSAEKVKKTELAAFLSKFSPTTNPFAAFSVLPKGTHFHTQEEGEEIILLLRRHPITNIVWIFIAIIFLLAPIVGLPIINLGGLVVLLDRISPGLLPTLLAFWYMAVTGYILLNFFFWYFNVNIVTTRRILDFDFFYLLYREFSEALLSRIEDVTSKGSGIFSALFNYGDVHVQTAAARECIEFLKVPRPQQVVRIITDLVEAQK